MSEAKIVWHKYPDEVPPRFLKYLVSIQSPTGTIYVDTLFYWNWVVGAEFRISIKKPELQGLRP